MFMFEKLDACGRISQRILYTGDFRFEDESKLSQISALHDEEGNTLNIDTMYLDTTFLTNDYKHFPRPKLNWINSIKHIKAIKILLGRLKVFKI